MLLLHKQSNSTKQYDKIKKNAAKIVHSCPTLMPNIRCTISAWLAKRCDRMYNQDDDYVCGLIRVCTVYRLLCVTTMQLPKVHHHHGPRSPSGHQFVNVHQRHDNAAMCQWRIFKDANAECICTFMCDLMPGAIARATKHDPNPIQASKPQRRLRPNRVLNRCITCELVAVVAHRNRAW